MSWIVEPSIWKPTGERDGELLHRSFRTGGKPDQVAARIIAAHRQERRVTSIKGLISCIRKDQITAHVGGRAESSRCRWMRQASLCLLHAVLLITLADTEMHWLYAGMRRRGAWDQWSRSMESMNEWTNKWVCGFVNQNRTAKKILIQAKGMKRRWDCGGEKKLTNELTEIYNWYRCTPIYSIAFESFKLLHWCWSGSPGIKYIFSNV